MTAWLLVAPCRTTSATPTLTVRPVSYTHLLGGHAFATVGPEDVFAVATVGATVDGHVFDDAQDGHADLLEHAQALARVQQGDVLRRGDDDGAGQRHALAQRERDVAGARRHVDQQVVQIPPVGLVEQLIQGLGGHRPAPDHGLVGFDQEADAHHLHTVVLHRLDGLAVGTLGAAGDTHHHGLAGAVDVGIQDAHAGAFGGQGQRQVDGRGALAHAALARSHGNDAVSYTHLDVYKRQVQSQCRWKHLRHVL